MHSKQKREAPGYPPGTSLKRRGPCTPPPASGVRLPATRTSDGRSVAHGPSSPSHTRRGFFMPEQDTTDDDFDVELEDKGFEQAPTALFMPDDDEPKVPDGAVRCYLVLRYLGATKNFRMNRAKIAKAMGVTDRSVRNYLAALEAAGWLLRTPVYAKSDRRGERPGHVRVLWKRATDDQLREHEAKVDAIRAAHKAQTEARKAAEPVPFRRRREPAGTRKGSSGHGRNESSGQARNESSGHGRNESSGHDPVSPQVRGPVSEGYPYLSTQTSTTQTSTN